MTKAKRHALPLSIHILLVALWHSITLVGKGVAWAARKFWRWLNTDTGKPSLREKLLRIEEKTGTPVSEELRERNYRP